MHNKGLYWARLPIDHTQVWFKHPLCYAVPPCYAFFYVFFFHPKNRVLGGDYCTCTVSMGAHFIDIFVSLKQRWHVSLGLQPDQRGADDYAALNPVLSDDASTYHAGPHLVIINLNIAIGRPRMLVQCTAIYQALSQYVAVQCACACGHNVDIGFCIDDHKSSTTTLPNSKIDFSLDVERQNWIEQRKAKIVFKPRSYYMNIARAANS